MEGFLFGTPKSIELDHFAWISATRKYIFSPIRKGLLVKQTPFLSSPFVFLAVVLSWRIAMFASWTLWNPILIWDSLAAFSSSSLSHSEEKWLYLYFFYSSYRHLNICSNITCINTTVNKKRKTYRLLCLLLLSILHSYVPLYWKYLQKADRSQCLAYEHN